MDANPFEYGGKTATIIGGGVTGASWAALFAAHGMKVVVSDPDPAVVQKAAASIESAQHALSALGYEPFVLNECVSFDKDNSRAVANAFVVQECGPERPAFKQALWKEIEAAAPVDALLCSSSSGIPASVQRSQMKDRSRLITAHPFNPPHLMPLVEVVPTPTTDPSVTARAVAFYNALGKVTRVIRKEVTGFVANRLQAALFQECVSLISQGVVTIDELDDIVASSLGVRWATSGPFLSFHLGGGAGGLPHFVEQLGPPMEQVWSILGHPTFDEATKKLIGRQAEASYGGSSIETLSQMRDEREIAVIKALARTRAS